MDHRLRAREAKTKLLEEKVETKSAMIAADTAASTPKIKHRTSVRVHWFISDCKTKREADWQVIMDEQAL